MSTRVTQREYVDAELVNMLIEQSHNGKYVEVDSRSLYILKNLDVIEAVWFKERICFTVHGQLEESQIVRIVTSMKE